MSKCQSGDCSNDATKVVYRETTGEEREQSTRNYRQGAVWDQFEEISVCEDHLEEAQNEYPHIASKKP